ACRTGTPSAMASREARPPSTRVKGVRTPAASQTVLSMVRLPRAARRARRALLGSGVRLTIVICRSYAGESRARPDAGGLVGIRSVPERLVAAMISGGYRGRVQSRSTPSTPAGPRHPRSTAFLLAQVGAHAAAQFAERLAPMGLAPAHAGILR